MSRVLVFLGASLALTRLSLADPQLTSWYTAGSGQYARIYKTTADETSRTSVTTWSRGSGTQTAPTYAGVSEVSYSASWVYIRTTGLASHLMGPWYLDAAKQMLFPNYPANTGTIYRFPRAPVAPGTHSNTGNGPIGFFVNGVAFFDNRDAFSYSTTNHTDATPVNGITGDGIWNRNAYANELVTFDAALAHQAGRQYHYHVQPIAVRYQLGDHVTYNATTNRYSESTGAITRHSPIVAWAADGLPVYGPYGYGTATDATSTVRRMISGYVVRDGTNGTINLSSAGRHSLPQWAALVQGRAQALSSTQYGPDVSTTYAVGHYLEDYDYLGDLPAGPAYDLDRYNCRWCVTPEFPSGTYAYFSTLDAAGSPAFPYNIGRQFFGQATGAAVGTISEAVTIYFHGGPNMPMTFTDISRNAATSAVAVTWSSVDGATYQVDAAPDLGAWAPAATGVASGGTATTFNETTAQPRRYYRASRTGLASYDTTGFDTSALLTPAPTESPTAVAPSAARSAAPAAGLVRFTISLPPDARPVLPPAFVPLETVTVGDFAATNLTRPTRETISGLVRLSSGAQAETRRRATVRFAPPRGRLAWPSYSATAILETR